jgi:phospholipid/cholesterol/gamma-HCH transport system substrate-binding protein
MRWSTAASVGVVVVLAMGILVFAYVLLASAGVVGNTYSLLVEFDNAQGVTKGTEVRLAGVKIGDVEKVDVSPGNRALLKLRIAQKYTVPADAEIRLASSGLLTTPVVEIVPRRRRASAANVRQGTTPPTLDQLLPEGQRLITNLSELSKSMQSLIGDPRLKRDLYRSTSNIAEVSERGKAIAANFQEASGSARQIATQFKSTTARLDRTAALLQQTVGENRGRLGEVLTSVRDTMGAVQGLVQELTTVVADPKIKGSMRGTVVNLEQTSGNLAKLSHNLEQLSGDPKLNEDLRATVTGTRATVEETQRLLERLNRFFGSSRRSVAGARERVQNTDLTVDVAQQTSPGRPRLDLNAFIPGGPGRFYRFGIYDLTERNRLTMQVGQSTGSGSLRYGMFASRLGVGLDLGPPSHPRLSADVYSLSEPQLDLRARVGLRPGLDLTFGVQSLFDRNAPTVGVTLRK